MYRNTIRPNTLDIIIGINSNQLQVGGTISCITMRRDKGQHILRQGNVIHIIYCAVHVPVPGGPRMACPLYHKNYAELEIALNQFQTNFQ